MDDSQPTPKKKRRRYGWIVPLIVVILLGGLVVVIITLPSLVALPQTMNASRWQSQGIVHYAMQVADNRGLVTCQWQVEVQDEQVIRQTDLAVTPGVCVGDILTISDLFKTVDHYKGSVCGPNGCACDGAWVMTAHYDPQYGFPSYIKLALDPNQRWMHLEYWVPHGCTLIGALPREITVSGFAPLP